MPAAMQGNDMWDFSTVNTTSASSEVRCVVPRDFDGDGDIDCILVTRYGYEYCEGDGTGGYTATAHSVPSNYECCVNAADQATCDPALPGRGLAIGCTDMTTGEAAVVFVVDVTVASPIVVSLTLTGYYRATNVACDGDRALVCTEGDIFTPNSGGAALVTFSGAITAVTSRNARTRRASFVHLDGDGIVDAAVLVVSAAGDLVLTFQGIGGSLSTRGTLATGGSLSTEDVFWSDVDGDGWMEPQFVVSNLITQSSYFGLHRRMGTTGYSSSDYSVSTASFPYYVAQLCVQDTERLAVPPFRIHFDVTVLDGTGNLHHLRGFDESTGQFDFEETITSPMALARFVTVDYDRDGIFDLLCATQATAQLLAVRGAARAHTIPYPRGASTCGDAYLTTRAGLTGPGGSSPQPLVTGQPGRISMRNTQWGALGAMLFHARQASSPIALSSGCALYGDASMYLTSIAVRAKGTDADLYVVPPASAAGLEVHVQGATFSSMGAYLGVLDITRSINVRLGMVAAP
jgi:hypothetical protein